MSDLPVFALSIQQPWASLIVSGLKNIENRTWHTRFRGPILIHAGKKIDREAMEDVKTGIHPVVGDHLFFSPADFEQFKSANDFETGGIIGVAEITDCVTSHGNSWFVGPYGFLIKNARPLPFRPCRGALGFFRPQYT